MESRWMGWEEGGGGIGWEIVKRNFTQSGVYVMSQGSLKGPILHCKIKEM